MKQHFDRYRVDHHAVGLVVGVLLLGLSVLGLVSLVKSRGYYCSPVEYEIVFDGGSSHTSMAVYRWLAEELEGTGALSQLAYAKECGEAGLSSFAENPEGVVPGLEVCLDIAELVIPDFAHRETPLLLGATAGMRLLDATNPEESDAVFRVVRETFKATPFLFDDAAKQARILPGSTEGTSSWISANYLGKKLGVEPVTGGIVDVLTPRNPIPVKPTLGALDLGGASTQITFLPENPSEMPEQYQQHLRLYGTDYTVYTHSFLCYGGDEAIRRYLANLVKDSGFAEVILDPCGNKGYSRTVTGSYLWKAPCSSGPQAIKGWGSEVTPAPGVTPDIMDTVVYRVNGTGNPDECYKIAKDLFDFDAECDFPPCSFNGVYTPLLHGSYRGMRSFAFTADGLGLSERPTIEEFNSATADYCKKTYKELEVLPGPMKYKVRYCFLASYIRVLLFDAYKFNEKNWDIAFNTEVNGINVGWDLGYAINTTGWIPEQESCTGLAPATMDILIVSFGVAAFVGFAIVLLVTRRRLGGKKSMEKSYQHGNV